jgi:diguanylate cyclase (GGDEF)-like protein
MVKPLLLVLILPTLVFALVVGNSLSPVSASVGFLAAVVVSVGEAIALYQPWKRFSRAVRWRAENFSFYEKRISEDWAYPELKEMARSLNKILSYIHAEHFPPETMELLMETVPGVVAWIDRDLRYLRVNRRLAEMFQIEPEAFIGQHLSFCDKVQPFTERLVNFVASDQDYLSQEISLVIDDKETNYALTARKNPPDGSVVVVVIDITARKRAEERSRRQSSLDPLTGLANRILFNANLAIALERAEQAQQKLAILFFDLDRFRIVNDSLGHSIGDLLLQTVAKLITEAVRKRWQDAVIARWGGDEFTILLPVVPNSESVIATAREILAVLNQDLLVGGYSLRTTASIGIAVYPDDGEDNESLTKNADAALHFAKSRGRNSWQMYSRHMNLHSENVLILENSLHRAIAKEEFAVYYQPKVDAQTGRITGLEALIRWHHPDLGLVMPSEFVPLAEDNGLVVPLGEWILREVCLQNRQWRDRGLPMLPIAVNLSVRQFLQPNLLEVVERTLKQAGIPPRYLEVEITESLAMNDIEVTRAILKRFYQINVGITIDDFGTGYSCLSSLKHFPVNALKIDRSFIKDIADNREDQAIVQGIVTLGRGLNLRTIAEGVETIAQLEILRSLHCTEVQGYLFSRPMSAEDMTQLLAQTSGELVLPPKEQVRG